jgi:hypothetical protein
MSRQPTTLSKPMPRSNAEAALAFAEAKTPAPQAKPTAASEKRVFFAPEGYRRLTINLPEELHKKLRLAAIEQDCSATDIVERLLVKELEK